MDSLTQFVLGAGVGAAVLGRKLGPRKAALVGGVLGTLPDLDVLVPFADPVDAFVLHRGPSHSLIMQALATPLIGEVLIRSFKALRDQRLTVYLAVYACLATHALLDAMTVYGTRVFWPLDPEPVGLGSVFIIDPLYTLPLLLATIWALCLGTWTRRFASVLAVALAVSTAYLGWSAVGQQMARGRAEAVLAEAGVTPERLMVTATPFNTLFWRAIAVDGDRYLNVYVPLLGSRDAVAIHAHPRGSSAGSCLASIPAVQKLAAFSKGFYRVEQRGEEIAIADLRMGLTPNYVFRFVVAREADGAVQAIDPVQIRGGRRGAGDLPWLVAGLGGRAAARLAEAGTELATGRLARDEAAPTPRLC